MNEHASLHGEDRTRLIVCHQETGPQGPVGFYIGRETIRGMFDDEMIYGMKATK